MNIDPYNYIGPHFDGATYVPSFDHTRLSNQLSRVYGVLSDGKWITLSQLSIKANCPEASASSRLRDLRKDKFGGHTVHRKRGDKYNDGLFYYRLEIEPQQEMRV